MSITHSPFGVPSFLSQCEFIPHRQEVIRYSSLSWLLAFNLIHCNNNNQLLSFLSYLILISCTLYSAHSAPHFKKMNINKNPSSSFDHCCWLLLTRLKFRDAFHKVVVMESCAINSIAFIIYIWKSDYVERTHVQEFLGNLYFIYFAFGLLECEIWIKKSDLSTTFLSFLLTIQLLM